MNFPTEKMAKALDLPNRSYFTELKNVKPAVFNTCQNLYNEAFKTFFNDVTVRIKKFLASQMDLSKFVTEVQAAIKARAEVEEEFQKRRQSSSDEDLVAPKKPRVSMNTYIWSDDEIIPPSGSVSELDIWKKKHENLERDFHNLNQRYSSCKAALAHQIRLNQTLEAENTDLKLNCVCGKIKEILSMRQ